ncbi:hypothetical protein [Paucibacter sp. KCTC 42545]|uniref:hypothetical protein n=1 Tax=Paucibacter sp. KCTC 42545 TaxID=1768242 RepID=UPI000733B8C4|nr:hypothetical protein [Paucibacter sp. KCTC 42545]ALT78375.1 hypothetical protein AT984_15455 [Paucibacter sp. KCTC 42545]
MNSSKQFLTAILFTMIGGTAIAATPGSRVVIQEDGGIVRMPANVRTDVDKACPGFAQTLQSELKRTWEHSGESGSLLVRFDVEGGVVSSVQQFGGLRESFGTPVRRAMAKLQCNGGNSDSGKQSFTFVLDFGGKDAPEVAKSFVLTAPAEVVARR